MDLRALYDYADRCRGLLYTTLAAHPEALDRQIGTTSPYATIRRLLTHMMSAEQYWIGERLAWPAADTTLPSPHDTVDAIFALWARIRANTYAFINTLDEAALEREIAWESREGAFALSVDDILFHLINHETNHRAQIAMALQMMGIEPPDFDFDTHRNRRGRPA